MDGIFLGDKRSSGFEGMQRDLYERKRVLSKIIGRSSTAQSQGTRYFLLR
jgi:hypothetical protein